MPRTSERLHADKRTVKLPRVGACSKTTRLRDVQEGQDDRFITRDQVSTHGLRAAIRERKAAREG